MTKPGATRAGVLTTKSSAKKPKQFEEPELPPVAPSEYVFLAEYAQEQMYSELLKHLITFKQMLTKKIALWRELFTFLSKLSKQLHRFHTPELHDLLTDVLLVDVQRGN